jgi:hypothetical protein
MCSICGFLSDRWRWSGEAPNGKIDDREGNGVYVFIG